MKILLLDGNNLGWMAFGQAPLTYQGNRVETIFIGMNMVRSLLDKFDPDQCVIAMDYGLDPERKALFPEYKRKKKKKLTEVEIQEIVAFKKQLGTLQDLLKKFGLTFCQCKDCEADDIIFSLIDYYMVCKSSPLDTEYIVVSTDKDFYQLYSYWDNVEIYNPVKKEIITRESIEERFEIPCEWYLEYKAMVGDPSDNLPGVSGIGPKKASWLINNIMIIDVEKDNSIASLKHSEEKMVDLLYANLDRYTTMKELVRLKHIGNDKLAGSFSSSTFNNASELDESMLREMGRYGFQSRINDFAAYTKPFTKLWVKGVS